MQRCLHTPAPTDERVAPRSHRAPPAHAESAIPFYLLADTPPSGPTAGAGPATEAELPGWFCSRTITNLSDVHCVLETPAAFFVVAPFHRFTLHDLVTFSPGMVASSYAKSLFVVYQVRVDWGRHSKTSLCKL